MRRTPIGSRSAYPMRSSVASSAGLSGANPALAADIVPLSQDSKGVGMVAEIATAKTEDLETLVRIEVVARRKAANKAMINTIAALDDLNYS